jgi:hypothetical protein
MKIVRLQAEGFKRLVAVDISPEGGLVEVRGNNAEGKSSVLDAIFAAFGGAAAAPIKPVRTGEEYAIIRADLGDLKVTRYFDAEGADRLKVENGEGASYAEPQTMLNKLVGRIAFDPLEFARMKPEAQAAELRRLVPLRVDLDALAKADKDDTASRRDVNRDAKAIKVRLDAIIAPAELPEKPDRSAIVAALGSAGEKNGAIEREKAKRTSDRRALDGYKPHIDAKRERAFEARKQAERWEQEADTAEREMVDGIAAIDALPALDELIDTAKLSADLDAADRVLRLYAAKEGRDALAAEFEQLRVRSESYTTAMADRATLRATALAEAEMPVPGLSLATVDDATVVTFEGEPFAQASGAQQLRVSMALAMAANPKLRVMLIKDGSLLDENGLRLVRELAGERDYQVWLEAVGQGDGVGIIMEGGKVRGAAEPERVEPPKRRRTKADAAPADKLTEAGVHHALPLAEANKVADFIAEETAKEAAPAKPRAMRSFATKPAGGLFGDGL